MYYSVDTPRTYVDKDRRTIHGCTYYPVKPLNVGVPLFPELSQYINPNFPECQFAALAPPVMPLSKCKPVSSSNLSQYINPKAHEKARQAIQAHQEKDKVLQPVDTYKTVMCQNWLETATCGFGPYCKFAHGETELRFTTSKPPQVDSRKYKTRLCDKYTNKGICPYGKRCLFIHADSPVNNGVTITTSTSSHEQIDLWSTPTLTGDDITVSRESLNDSLGCTKEMLRGMLSSVLDSSDVQLI